MKKEYPNYRKLRLRRDDLEKQLKLNKSEKEAIENFLDFCGIKANRNKIEDKKTILLQIRDVLEKSLTSITKKDLIGFAGALKSSDKEAWTKSEIKIVFKQFLKWYYEDWSSRFGELNDIIPNNAPTKVNHKRINPAIVEKVLESLPKILYGAKSIRDEAVIMLLYEVGGRPHEIRLLKWGDLELNRNPPTVTLHTSKGNKDESRRLLIDKSKAYLERWKKQYPFEYEDENYIFPSKADAKKPLHETQFNYLFKKASKRAGLSFTLFPYLLRHVRITELTNRNLSDKFTALFGGHSTRMSAYYSQLSDKNLHDQLLTVAYDKENIGKKEEPWFENFSVQKELEEIKKERNESRQQLAELKLDVDDLKQFKNSWEYTFEKMKQDPLRFFISGDGELCEKAIIYVNGKEINLIKNPEINVTRLMSR